MFDKIDIHTVCYQRFFFGGGGLHKKNDTLNIFRIDVNFYDLIMHKMIFVQVQNSNIFCKCIFFILITGICYLRSNASMSLL